VKTKITAGTANGRAYCEIEKELKTPEYTPVLVNYLDFGLLEDTLVDGVYDAGTRWLTNSTLNRRVFRDVISSVKLAGRNV